jgi:hypothetical protein
MRTGGKSCLKGIFASASMTGNRLAIASESIAGALTTMRLRKQTKDYPHSCSRWNMT